MYHAQGHNAVTPVRLVPAAPHSSQARYHWATALLSIIEKALHELMARKMYKLALYQSKTQIILRLKRSLTRVANGRSTCMYIYRIQRLFSGEKLKLWYDFVDPQTNLYLRLTHMPTCTICCIPAQINLKFSLLYFYATFSMRGPR